MVSVARPRLANISPDPGTWSNQEIPGLLVDSAANHHRRFVWGAQGLAAAGFPTNLAVAKEGKAG